MAVVPSRAPQEWLWREMDAKELSGAALRMSAGARVVAVHTTDGLWLWDASERFAPTPAPAPPSLPTPRMRSCPPPAGYTDPVASGPAVVAVRAAGSPSDGDHAAESPPAAASCLPVPALLTAPTHEPAWAPLFAPLPARWGRVRRVACGSGWVVVLTASGAAFSRGRNTHGQCGAGFTGAEIPELTAMPGPEAVVDAALGAAFTALRTASGSVWTCGRNDQGQLGIGAGWAARASLHRVPLVAAGVRAVSAIAAAATAVLCTAASGGAVVAWGAFPCDVFVGTAPGAPPSPRRSRVEPRDIGFLPACIAPPVRADAHGDAVAIDAVLGRSSEAERRRPLLARTPSFRGARIRCAGARAVLIAEGSLWACGAARFGGLGFPTPLDRGEAVPCRRFRRCLRATSPDGAGWRVVDACATPDAIVALVCWTDPRWSGAAVCPAA